MHHLLATLLLLAPVAGHAASPRPPPRWTAQVDPLTTYLGFVHLQIERTLGDHFSLYAGPHLRLFSAPTADAEDFLGAGVEVGLRYYFSGTAPAGWWGLLRGVGARAWTDDEAALAGYVSGLGGYTWIADWFVLSGGAGVQYIHYRVDGLGPKGVFPALHTAIGVAW